MAFTVADRVRETTLTTGTGDVTLAGTVQGFRTFASALAVGDTCWYAISGGSDWELGIGTLTAATVLQRTTVLSSSAGGTTKASFATGTKDVILTLPAALLAAIADFANAEATVASSATTDLGPTNARDIVITGSAAITSFGTRANAEKLLRFAGSATLTFNATSLILPGGRDIVTQPGDVAHVTSDASGNWRVRHYDRADGTPVVPTPANRFYDPGMFFSQEYGGASVPLTNSGQFYWGSDQVATYRFGSSGMGAVQNLALRTPGGSVNRHRLTVTTAGTPAAGDALIHYLRIEGVDLLDMAWGTPAAKTFTLRLGIRSSLAGTFGLSFGNNDFSRCYGSQITIAAGEVNTDVVRTVTIPGDMGGTWTLGASAGLHVRIAPSYGTNFGGTTGAWVAANVLGPTTNTNLLGTLNATFDIFDAGLYDGVVAPAFTLPKWDDVLRKCQRYYEVGSYSLLGSVPASGHYVSSVVTLVPKRSGYSITNLTASFVANMNSPVAISALGQSQVRFFQTSTASTPGAEITGTFVANSRM